MNELIYRHSYGEEAAGLVYRNQAGEYEVWEVPQYGGMEQFEKVFAPDQLAAAIAYSKSFT